MSPFDLAPATKSKESQFVWPWLIDYAAVLASNGTSATLSRDTLRWHGDADVLYRLLSTMNMTSLLMVEIGVDAGDLSRGLLQRLHGLHLVGIDPYPNVYGGIPSVTLCVL